MDRRGIVSTRTRILASHGGVLPRPADLQAMADTGQDEAFERRLPSAIAEGVQQQLDVGMDVVNDGEYVKRSGFNGYIRERIAGVEPRPSNPTPNAGAIWTTNRTGARDQNEFPGFHAAHRNNSSVTAQPPASAEPVSVNRATVAHAAPAATRDHHMARLLRSG